MRTSLLVGLVLAALPAFAQFEGTLHMKMTSAQAGGTMKLHVGKEGGLGPRSTWASPGRR